MLSQIQRSLQCTERLNDPVILLGVLCRMRKLELLGQNLKYSSPEFAKEILELSNDVSDSIKVNLGGRTGERNIIRNSSQYWRAVGLIPNDRSGRIQLTEFGRKVADRDTSQTEFAEPSNSKRGRMQPLVHCRAAAAPVKADTGDFV